MHTLNEPTTTTTTTSRTNRRRRSWSRRARAGWDAVKAHISLRRFAFVVFYLALAAVLIERIDPPKANAFEHLAATFLLVSIAAFLIDYFETWRRNTRAFTDYLRANTPAPIPAQEPSAAPAKLSPAQLRIIDAHIKKWQETPFFPN